MFVFIIMLFCCCRYYGALISSTRSFARWTTRRFCEECRRSPPRSGALCAICTRTVTAVAVQLLLLLLLLLVGLLLLLLLVAVLLVVVEALVPAEGQAAWSACKRRSSSSESMRSSVQ